VPFANPVNVKLPEASAVVVPLAGPLNVSVVPVPLAAGLTLPEMLHVGIGVAVKLTAVMFAPLTVTGALAGLKVTPVFDGVTV
jgi:hypothetical protein